MLVWRGCGSQLAVLCRSITLVLNLGITPGSVIKDHANGARGTVWGAEHQPWSVLCMARTLPAVLYLWPLISQCFLVGTRHLQLPIVAFWAIHLLQGPHHDPASFCRQQVSTNQGRGGSDGVGQGAHGWLYSSQELRSPNLIWAWLRTRELAGSSQERLGQM